MGYLIPGNKFARYGDHLLNADSNGGVSSLPDIRPGIMPLNKTAALRSATAFAGADISRSAPTFNDPRYSFTTLSIPTDLRTLNGLYRFFDDTDPVVGNSLRLHVEFPLSRVSLKQLPDPVIQRHYEEMCSKINFEKLLFDIGLEYWRIGNVFTFGAWNTAEHMWDQFVILNPDYVTVESTYLNQRPLIKLQPDEHLKKVVSTGQPKFLYDQLPKEIIKYVRMGQEIPLSPNNTFHISHNRAPYETLGRSIIKRILKTLIYEDRMSMANFAIATRQVIPLTVVKLGDANSGWIPSNEEIDSWKEIMAAREIDANFCYDEKTECLTDKGWVKWDQLTFDHKIASFNSTTNGLEYHNPSHINIQDYDGEMIHFKSRKINVKVTPNHRMWVKRDGQWQIVLAENVKDTDTFRSTVDRYEYTSLPDTLEIAGKKVDTGDFFEFIGWYISEGSIGGKNGKNYTTVITQTEKGELEAVKQIMKKLPWKHACYNGRDFTIAGKLFADYCVDQFGKGASKKKLPRWVLDAPPQYLERLFWAYILGDGTIQKNKNSELYSAHTASPELADALYEIGVKLGYAVSDVEIQPKSYKHTVTGEIHYKKKDGTDFFLHHRLNFSKDPVACFPKLKRRNDYNGIKEPVIIGEVPRKGRRIDWGQVNLQSILSLTGNTARKTAELLGCSVGTVLNQMDQIGVLPREEGTRESKYNSSGNIQRVPYTGKIWCVTVPTGIIITRREGIHCAHGQSVVYHWGVDVQFYGASSRIWNLTAEFNRVMKWKLIGLGISEGLLTGGSSYATAYAQLEVLRQRYLHFQHMLGHFVYKGIFEPVAQQCGFYKTSALTSGPGYIGRKFGNTKDGFKDPLSGDEIEKHASEFNNPLTAKYLDHLQKQSHVTDTQYVYPELDWDLLSLGNDVQYRNFLMNFDKLFPGVRKISDTTFYRAAKLDPETEQANLLREYQTEMEQKLEKGKLEKKYRQEFEKEGIPFPGMMGAPPPGQPGAPGPGGTPGPGGMLVPPGAPPPMGGTGGGNLPGTPAMTPNSPLGQNQFQGMAPGRPGAPPNPAASRVQSLELQRRLTSSFAEIESENDLEAAQLKISNQEAGILSVEDEDAEL